MKAPTVQLLPDNKIDISESLTTHSVWQNTIKCDPLDKKLYPEQERDKKKKGGINVCDLLTRTTGSSLPACAKCGESGHLTYQCRNTFTIKDGKVVKGYFYWMRIRACREMLAGAVKGGISDNSKAIKKAAIESFNNGKSKKHHHKHKHKHHHHKHRSKGGDSYEKCNKSAD